MRLLVVDEDINILTEIYMVLSRKGFNIVTEENPIEAINLCKYLNFNVVISGVEMKRMDGIELLKQLKKINKNMFVILITRNGYLETSEEALNNGASAYLEMPFDLNELLKYLKEIEIKIKNKTFSSIHMEI